MRADPPPLVIRDREGRWTAEYLALREEMGAPPRFLAVGAAHALMPLSSGKGTYQALIRVQICANIRHPGLASLRRFVMSNMRRSLLSLSRLGT